MKNMIKEIAQHSISCTLSHKLFAARVCYALLNFPLGTVLMASYKFQYVIFSLSFTSKYFLISMRFLLWYMGHLGIRTMLLDFQTFGDFLVFFLLLISCLISLWTENILNNFSSLSFFEIGFRSQETINFGKCSMCTWKGCVFYDCWVKRSTCVSEAKFVHCIAHSFYTLIDLLFYQFLREVF